MNVANDVSSMSKCMDELKNVKSNKSESMRFLRKTRIKT